MDGKSQIGHGGAACLPDVAPRDKSDGAFRHDQENVNQHEIEELPFSAVARLPVRSHDVVWGDCSFGFGSAGFCS